MVFGRKSWQKKKQFSTAQEKKDYLTKSFYEYDNEQKQKKNVIKLALIIKILYLLRSKM